MVQFSVRGLIECMVYFNSVGVHCMVGFSG